MNKTVVAMIMLLSATSIKMFCPVEDNFLVEDLQLHVHEELVDEIKKIKEALNMSAAKKLPKSRFQPDLDPWQWKRQQ